MKLRVVILAFVGLGCSNSGKPEQAGAAFVEPEQTEPKVVSASMLPEGPEDRGKFVAVCLDRSLRPRETYGLKMTFLVSTGNQHQCRHIVSGAACFKLNVLCINRFTTAEESRIMREEINAGTVDKLTVVISETHDETSAKTYTFEKL